MRRISGALQLLCGNKTMMEPYIASFHVSSHNLAAKEIEITKPPQEETISITLPKLPVPKLNETLTKYLKTVKPHLSNEEYAHTSELVKEFSAEGGVGQKLQSILEQKAKEKKNWLEDWWLSTAYLEYRNPVVVFSSPGLVFPPQDFQCVQDQLLYAGKTIRAAMEYKRMIDEDKIPTEMMGKNPLDMSQYKKIFGTCRLPGIKKDTLSYNSDSKYITVIRNGHFFHMDLWGDDGLLFNEQQIAEQLSYIVSMSEIPTSAPVGILTSDNRDAWGVAYAHLSKDSVNRESLSDIERSLAVLCLDVPVGLQNFPDKSSRQTVAAAQTVHGYGSYSNGGNRWFDKTVQFIVGADGVTGLTYEHSPAEGQPIAVLTDFIINYIDSDQELKPPSNSPKQPRYLEFKIDSIGREMIRVASDNLNRLVEDLELNCFSFDNYGKEFIKSQKLSPDSFIQMAMQYAFYRLYNTPAAHYESAATRMYEGGRTETIRSCSEESVNFAKAMLDTNKSNKDRVEALKSAIKAHKDYTVMALQGLGVDRHMLGLRLAAIENGMEVPKLYSDPGYVKSTHMRLSTSQVACKCDGFMVYGPLVADGYATCYNPRERNINFGTSAFVSDPTTSCHNYRWALEQSLNDMHDLLMHTTPAKL